MSDDTQIFISKLSKSISVSRKHLSISFSRQWPMAGASLGDKSIVHDASIARVSPYFIFTLKIVTGVSAHQLRRANLDVSLVLDTAEMVLVEEMDVDTVEAKT